MMFCTLAQSTAILLTVFQTSENQKKVQKAVVSPKSLFHLAYMPRVPGLTLGLMRFRESSKSLSLMLRICGYKQYRITINTAT